ncbi:MAG: 50S ribosomal protein L2, partial [Cyanobacteriota bacterium]
MAIRTYRPTSPGTRTLVLTDFRELTGQRRERGLVVAKHR